MGYLSERRDRQSILIDRKQVGLRHGGDKFEQKLERRLLHRIRTSRASGGGFKREGRGEEKITPDITQPTPFKDKGEKQGTNLSKRRKRSGEAEEEVAIGHC